MLIPCIQLGCVCYILSHMTPGIEYDAQSRRKLTDKRLVEKLEKAGVDPLSLKIIIDLDADGNPVYDVHEGEATGDRNLFRIPERKGKLPHRQTPSVGRTRHKR
jgi:hypothetical protein